MKRMILPLAFVLAIASAFTVKAKSPAITAYHFVNSVCTSFSSSCTGGSTTCLGVYQNDNCTTELTRN